MKYHIMHDFRTSIPFEEKSSHRFQDPHELKLLKVTFLTHPSDDVILTYKNFSGVSVYEDL